MNSISNLQIYYKNREFSYLCAMRFRIDLSYDGAPFCGWQVQRDSPSVQGALEAALATLLRTPVRVVGAGRTDTGVNASRYVAHFDFDGPVDPAQLCYKLNAVLPDAVAVSSVSQVSEDFHARFGARRREYTYYLHRRKDPFAARFSYLYAYPELDFEAMNAAAAHLLGTRDFSCFEKTGGDNKTSVCTIFEASWQPCECIPGSGVPQYRFVIAGDRFLRNMVRAIVGTLLEVGRGKRTEEQFRDLISSGTRCDAGESVPGHALFLTDIEY